MKVIAIFREKPFHLFLFPILFTLYHFFAIVVPEELPINFGVIAANFIGASVLCICCPYSLYRILSVKWGKVNSSILSTILFLPFFFFQDLFLSTEELFVGVRMRWLLPVLCVLMLVILYLLIKTKKRLSVLNEYLNVASFFLVGYTTCMVIISFERMKPHSFDHVPAVYDLTRADNRDIYFLVLDSYTSNKSLSDYFQYDNSAFVGELNKLGFEIADESISAYSFTKYSIAATLNLNYIDSLDRYGSDYGVKETIRCNAVVKSLQKENYEIENLSLFDIDSFSHYYTLSSGIRIGFIRGIFQSSILQIPFTFFQKRQLFDLHLDVLNKIRASSERKQLKPKFVYAHV